MKLFQTDKEDLKAAVMNLVRNLPITIEYMAAATLVSTIFFHFSNNVTNISIIFTLAIILIARATSCYGSGILASLFALGKLCIHISLHDAELYHVRIPDHVCGHDADLLYYQQHLHHDHKAECPDPGKGPDAA